MSDQAIKNIMKIEALKKALLKKELLDQLPKEAFSQQQLQLIREAQHQWKTLSVDPTFKSIAHECLLNTKPDQRAALKQTIVEINNAASIDDAQFQVELFRLNTEAIMYCVKMLNILYESDPNPKDLNQLHDRINELKETKEEQWHAPVNAKQWQLLESAEQDELRVEIDWFLDHDVTFKKKVLYSFIATTNGGKTVIKTWLATKFIRSGYNVLYLAQEEPYSDTIRRVHQTCLDMTEAQYKEETKEGFETVGERFNQMSAEKGWGNIFVVEWPNIPVQVLKSKIKQFKKEHDVELDAIIIDYGKLVATSDSNRNIQEWERIGQIFKDLKAMCMESNICCITSIQLNRESSKALIRNNRTPDLTDVAGAYEATHHANYVWSVKLKYDSRHDPAQVEYPYTIRGFYTLTVQKQKYGRLRKGDSHAFYWHASHELTPMDFNTDPVENLDEYNNNTNEEE